MDTSLSDPVSAECPCGPDLEYDPEYLLLFTRAAPREEAQYGDFVSTPEIINWAELERDARRLLTRSKDIRILVVLLRCRIQQAGARDWRRYSRCWKRCAPRTRTPSTRNCSRLKISPPKRRLWHAVTRWRRCWTTKA